MKSGALRPRNLLLAFGGVILLSIVAVPICAWDMQRQVKFDAEQWKHPYWRWDRWRMMNDLEHQLDQTHPDIDTVQKMLEGDPEKSDQYRDQDLKTFCSQHFLVYTVGVPFDDFFLPESHELRLYFTPAGKLSYRERGEGNADIWW
jgi:hypothetical protein